MLCKLSVLYKLLKYQVTKLTILWSPNIVESHCTKSLSPFNYSDITLAKFPARFHYGQTNSVQLI